jgi:hypothetical protein
MSRRRRQLSSVIRFSFSDNFIGDLENTIQNSKRRKLFATRGRLLPKFESKIRFSTIWADLKKFGAGDKTPIASPGSPYRYKVNLGITEVVILSGITSFYLWNQANIDLKWTSPFMTFKQCFYPVFPILSFHWLPLEGFFVARPFFVRRVFVPQTGHFPSLKQLLTSSSENAEKSIHPDSRRMAPQHGSPHIASSLIRSSRCHFSVKYWNLSSSTFSSQATAICEKLANKKNSDPAEYIYTSNVDGSHYERRIWMYWSWRATLSAWLCVISNSI